MNVNLALLGFTQRSLVTVQLATISQHCPVGQHPLGHWRFQALWVLMDSGHGVSSYPFDSEGSIALTRTNTKKTSAAHFE